MTFEVNKPELSLSLSLSLNLVRDLQQKTHSTSWSSSPKMADATRRQKGWRLPSGFRVPMLLNIPRRWGDVKKKKVKEQSRGGTVRKRKKNMAF